MINNNENSIEVYEEKVIYACLDGYLYIVTDSLQ